MKEGVKLTWEGADFHTCLLLLPAGENLALLFTAAAVEYSKAATHSLSYKHTLCARTNILRVHILHVRRHMIQNMQ